MPPCPATVSLDQPAYTAHENQGELTITIERTGDLSLPEHVGYGVKQQDGQDGIDFHAIPNTYVTMAPGQQHVLLLGPDHRSGDRRARRCTRSPTCTAPGPAAAARNTNSIITILHDDPLAARDPPTRSASRPR